MKNYLNRAVKLGISYRIIFILILLSMVTTATEMFGIGMLLPIFQFIKFNGDLDVLSDDTGPWSYVITFFDWIGLNPSLMPLLLIGFSLFLLKQIFTYINMVYSAAVSQKIIQDIKNRIFGDYMRANSTYHDDMPTGNLVNVVTTEVNSAVRGAMVPIELAVYSVMLLGYFFILFYISWEVTTISAFVLFAASSIPKVWIKASREVGRKLVGANIAMSEFLIGRINSPELIRLSGTEIAEKSNFSKLTRMQRKHSVHNAILKAKVDVVMEPIVIGLIMGFLYISSASLSLPIEIIGIYLLVSIRLLPIVKGVISKWQTVQKYLGSIEVIENRFEEMRKFIEVDTGSIELADINNIRFDNVNFKYQSNGSNTLNNISLNIKACTTVAIVGSSGSGKSTLIDLLPRIRVPNSGNVLINDINIKQYTLASVRKMISYAPQSPKIFDGTIMQHILYGKSNATHEEVVKAAQIAEADQFINALPDGYDTQIGEEASKLSGGQRQRLDLARALVKQSSVLILDEPTSNLDIHSEKSFIRALTNIRKETDMIIIIISHRLSSIQHANQIVVLNHGLIESVGTHAELLGNSLWYSEAWKSHTSS